jgi:hypothetical protein
MLQNPTQSRAHVLLSQDTGGSFGSSRPAMPSSDEFLADFIAIRLNSCADEEDLINYPTARDVYECITRFLPNEQRMFNQAQSIAQSLNSVIDAVGRNFQTANEPEPSPREALRLAIAAFDRGLIVATDEEAQSNPSLVSRLKALLDNPAFVLAPLVGESATGEIDADAVREVERGAQQSFAKQMELLNASLHAKRVSAASEDISAFVDRVGENAYHEFRRAWAQELESEEDYERVGGLTRGDELARALWLQAQAEVVFESKYHESREEQRPLLIKTQAEAIEQRLRLKSCESLELGDSAHQLYSYLFGVAFEPAYDMFLRREALEHFVVAGVPKSDLHHLETLVANEDAPLCVRFTAEVTRRRLALRSS